MFCQHHSGHCPSNFEAAMEAEHCTQAGSTQKFKTTNYTEIESYPKQEWEIIMKGAACPEHDMRFNRRIPVVSELCELPLAKKAALLKAEVIAIVMYTGPMVCWLRFLKIRAKAFIIVAVFNIFLVCSMSSTTPSFVNFLRRCTKFSIVLTIFFRQLFLFWPLLFKGYLVS